MTSYIESLRDPGNSEKKREIFLLTKPPYNDSTKLCFKIIDRSDNAILYLMGDGVYNLMSKSLDILSKEKIFACKEDMDARGIRARENATILADFYEHFVEDIMGLRSHVYTF